MELAARWRRQKGSLLMTQTPSPSYFKIFASRFWLLFSLTLVSCSLTVAFSHASNPAEYLTQLKIAERKILRSKNIKTSDQPNPNRSEPHLLTSAIPPLYFGRNYQVGDSWRVAALQTDSSIMRMTSDPHHLRHLNQRIGIFRYRVIAIQDGSQPEFTIEVTQESELSGSKFPLIDPRVEKLTLKMTPETVQTQKEYSFRGRSHRIQVAPEGLRSAVTPLEMYPLDIPEVFTAEKSVPTSFPQLPAELQKLRSNPNLINLTKSFWFEQDDFFGRPIQVLWQKGDPWPAYIKTANGIAILISLGDA